MLSIQPSRNQVLRRILQEPTTIIGILLLIIFALAALGAPLISHYDPLFQNISVSLSPPSSGYWFGTDKLGRDLFSRMVYGARISLRVGLLVVIFAGTFGSLVGLIAGYLRGWVDEVLMRVTDIFFAFPSLILAMAIAGALGPSLQNALIAVGVVSWPVYARLIRSQVLVLREQEFVLAARAIGVVQWKVLLRHLLPNTIAPFLGAGQF